MSIKLTFLMQTNLMMFVVDKQEVWYSDAKVFKKALRIIPRDEEFHKKLMLSRNKIPDFVDKFKLSAEDEKEYEANKDSEEKLADIIVKDCKAQGLVLIKRENESK